MNNIAILLLVALTVTGLAFIHETRLRRVGHHMLRRLIQSLGHKGSSRDGG